MLCEKVPAKSTNLCQPEQFGQAEMSRYFESSIDQFSAHLKEPLFFQIQVNVKLAGSHIM